MSRSGYSDGCDNWDLIRWRGAVASAIRGKRGQAFLIEMRAALDQMPERRLIAHELTHGGDVCAIGSVGVERGLDMATIDAYDRESVARAFGIAEALAAEIEYMNDEGVYRTETAYERWVRMRAWTEAQIVAGYAPPRPASGEMEE